MTVPHSFKEETSHWPKEKAEPGRVDVCAHRGRPSERQVHMSFGVKSRRCLQVWQLSLGQSNKKIGTCIADSLVVCLVSGR